MRPFASKLQQSQQFYWMRSSLLPTTTFRPFFAKQLDRQPRTLALPIQGPVLEEYNCIELRRNSGNRRIDHLLLKDLPPIDRSHSNESQGNRWEKSLGEYISAKQRFQTRKSNISSEFEFLRLNKINRYRKQKLMEANSLPLSIINSTDLHQTYSFDFNNAEARRSLKLGQSRQRVQTEKHAQTHQMSEERRSEGEQQQARIMNSILESYFKKKYNSNSVRQPLRAKIQKHSSAVLRKQKIKLRP